MRGPDCRLREVRYSGEGSKYRLRGLLFGLAPFWSLFIAGLSLDIVWLGALSVAFLPVIFWQFRLAAACAPPANWQLRLQAALDEYTTTNHLPRSEPPWERR